LRIIDPARGVWRLMVDQAGDEVTPENVDRAGYLRRALGRDVAGKAISAALYMARLTSELRSRAAIARTPARLLRRVNQEIAALGEEWVGGIGASTPRHPGTITVPARISASSPCSACTCRPPAARSGPGSTAQMPKSYQTGNSGRASPNISTATPNSKLHKPS